MHHGIWRSRRERRNSRNLWNDNEVLPKLVSDTKPWTPGRISAKNTTSTHTLFKLQRNKSKQARVQRNKGKNSPDSSSKTVPSLRVVGEIFSVEREKPPQDFRTLRNYPPGAEKQTFSPEQRWNMLSVDRLCENSPKKFFRGGRCCRWEADPPEGIMKVNLTGDGLFKMIKSKNVLDYYAYECIICRFQ